LTFRNSLSIQLIHLRVPFDNQLIFQLSNLQQLLLPLLLVAVRVIYVYGQLSYESFSRSRWRVFLKKFKPTDPQNIKGDDNGSRRGCNGGKVC
jgi:hypothetical protein